jgi:hypothetical protein
MFQMNDDQMGTLGQQRRAQFEQRLAAHGRKNMPSRCAHLDEARLKEAVTAIVDKAMEYGLRSELGITLYFNVAVCFGVDFPKNDRVQWVQPIAPGDDEVLDAGWIVRVSEIASLTLRRYGQ